MNEDDVRTLLMILARHRARRRAADELADRASRVSPAARQIARDVFKCNPDGPLGVRIAERIRV